MSRAFDFIVVGVIWIIAAVIHLIGVSLFAPDSPLYTVATDGTETMNGAARAAFMSEFFIIWLPLMAGIGIMAWAMIREYRRQAATAVQQGARL
jgi:hypothetical protein